MVYRGAIFLKYSVFLEDRIESLEDRTEDEMLKAGFDRFHSC